MQYNFLPSPSEGVDFIIEKARASTPDDPLWIIGLGAATDMAETSPRSSTHRSLVGK